MAILQNKFVSYRNSLRQINRAAKEDPQAFVKQTESEFHGSLRKIAERIASEEPICRLVMLAGPSASGKTTTAHLLVDALRETGTGADIISLDDFYRGEHQAPLLPDGRHDYESLEALNVPELRQCLSELVKSGRCNMPVFDFSIRLPYPHRRQVILEDRGIAVVEGIHALNPVLIGELPSSQIKRIYVSVKQGILNGKEEIFTPNDMRLVRRIVRDRNFRGTQPSTTLGMWNNVMDGERKYIKPFRTDADFTINSFHAYGPCVLKNQAADLLHTVPEEDPCYGTARMLLAGLDQFESIAPDLVPRNSILREFIGGGIYY